MKEKNLNISRICGGNDSVSSTNNTAEILKIDATAYLFIPLQPSHRICLLLDDLAGFKSLTATI